MLLGIAKRQAAPRRGAVRPNGLLVMLGCVGLGILSGSAYYHYKQPRMAAELQAQLDAAPTTLAGRLEQWHLSCAPMIHQRLTQVARFSEEHPWLVTHAFDEQGALPQVWGIELTSLPIELSRVEDLRVIVELPAPRLLGRVELLGDNAENVPHFAVDGPAPDAHERARELALWFLGGLPRALEKDIEGARVEVRIGPDASGAADGARG